MGGKPRSPDPTARSLATYRAMRRFDVTPEPSGAAAARPADGALSFVIQKHAARRLHYDFRLELDGVLLSWSVPKGPSLSPGDKRLAVRTEDHPLEYASFEGIIPKGEYGGGTVIVWDRGTWIPDGDPREALRKGRLSFELRGEKLTGSWHLVRTRMDDGKREHWLLLKSRDAAAAAGEDIVDRQPASVLSGRTLEAVGAAPERVWHSNRSRGEPPAATRASAPGSAPPPSVNALLRALPVGIPLTNLDKVLFPESGTTKGAVIAYLAAVADWMLPHLGGRPLTLVRCPDGRHRFCFYQKHAKVGIPASVGRVPIEEEGKVAEYLRVDDLAGLVALGQLGVLELHTWACHADDVERPDLLVFDLDPDPAIGWAPVVAAAVELRDRLAAVDLETFVTTTGGKGLHVVAPLIRRHDWEVHKAFSKKIVEAMAAAAPGRFVTTAAKARRTGKIFLDYLRNGRGATFITPYSPRAREGATVATPITWDELGAGVDPARFTIESVPRRLGQLAEDPWRRMRAVRQSITERARRAAGAA
jgi:bifunctional non-homologous end joining protein LigD